MHNEQWTDRNSSPLALNAQGALKLYQSLSLINYTGNISEIPLTLPEFVKNINQNLGLTP